MKVHCFAFHMTVGFLIACVLIPNYYNGHSNSYSGCILTTADITLIKSVIDERIHWLESSIQCLQPEKDWAKSIHFYTYAYAKERKDQWDCLSPAQKEQQRENAKKNRLATLVKQLQELMEIDVASAVRLLAYTGVASALADKEKCEAFIAECNKWLVKLG